MNYVEIEYNIIDLPKEEFVKYISDLNVDVNLIGYKGRLSLFFLLIKFNRFDLIEALEGLDLNSPYFKNMDTPLHTSCQLNNIKIVKFLLDKGVNPDPKDIDGRTPLHWCSTSKIASLLLEKGADINSKTNFNKSVLDLNCHFGLTEMVKFTLENGAEIEYENGELKCLNKENTEELSRKKIKELSDIILEHRMKRIKGARKG